MKIISRGEEPFQDIPCPYCGALLRVMCKDLTPIEGDYGTYIYGITHVSFICKCCHRKIIIDHKELTETLYEALKAPKEKSFFEKFMDNIDKFCDSLRF